MAAIALSALISRSRNRADMPLAGFVTDAELTDWINEGLQQIHPKLVDAYGEQYAFREQAFVTSAGVTDYALPSDFYRLWGIDFSFNGRPHALRPYTQADRNALRNIPVTLGLFPGSIPRYSFVADLNGVKQVRLLPAPPVSDCKFLYAPAVATLVAATPSGTVELPDGWEKYVIAYAAAQMLAKEESSTSELRGLITRWDAELEDLKATRDSAFPKQVTDVSRMDADESWWP